MARKGIQQRNGLKRGASNKYSDSEVGDRPLSYRRDKNEWEEGKLSDANEVQSEIHGSSDDHKKDGTDIPELLSNSKRNNRRSVKNSSRQRSNKHRMPNLEPLEPLVSQIRGTLENDILSDDTTTRGDNEVPVNSSKCSSNRSGGNTKEALSTHNATDAAGSSNMKSTCSLSILTIYALEMAKGWLANQKPRLSNLATIICEFCGLTRIKIEQSYPIIWSWILHIGKMIFLLSLVWLDCSLRGLDSLLRLGTSSFFTVFWCSTLSVVAMIGILKMSLIVVITGFVFIFIGLAFAIMVISVFAAIIVWVYGSFWTTGLVIFVGGVSFVFNHERIALFIATVYAVYSAKCYVGWLGLLLGFNVSFISGDVLIYILKNKIDDQRSCRPEQAWQSQSTADHTNEDPCHDPSMGDSFASASVRLTDRGPGMPSTSGVESELTSEEEIIRLLNCGDHYSALGLARYEMIDASHLKREYRRKAMLVHPDKNMGNEKAAEAFKKLQNAYEVLLDSMKRQAYNDDLRREELLNYLRRLQTTSHKNRKHRIFNASSTHPGGEDENFHGDSRRIACKKCGDFHVWAQTDKSKSRARWCQECKDFHLAKDGDGWVEQSFQPLLFGLLQKMEPPIAYVCADSKIYEVTEWFICQGMRCPANTHKPSFHVNTSIASRGSTTKGTSSASRGGGGGGAPTANTDDAMPEEFFEWLQKSGIFDGGSPSSESPVAKNSGSSKSNPKKKKKGKKQW